MLSLIIAVLCITLWINLKVTLPKANTKLIEVICKQPMLAHLLNMEHYFLSVITSNSLSFTA